MRVIFCGTPEIAVPSLRALSEIAEIVGVVCQPDRPAGRGMKLSPPPVKVEALSRGIEVFQPTKVRDGTLAQWMGDKQADFALVIAYGRILTKETLEAPRMGCLNLHASLLPEYRGAAPIQRAVMDGRTETGVCLMQMNEGMDTGPVLACRSIPIEATETAGQLAVRLGQLAAQITREELPRFYRGEVTAHEQAHERATYAPPISKDEAFLDFHRPSRDLVQQIRGLAPRPGAVCLTSEMSGKRLKIEEAESVVSAMPLRPGELSVESGQLIVGTGSAALRLLRVQLEGKNSQSGADLIRGRTVHEGQFLWGKAAQQTPSQ